MCHRIPRKSHLNRFLLNLMVTGIAVFVLGYSGIASVQTVSAKCTPDNMGTAGNDTIVCDTANKPGPKVYGKDGHDTITIKGGVFVTDRVAGDVSSSVSGNDKITVNGKANLVTGDIAPNGNGGDDIIIINGTLVSSNGRKPAVIGDGTTAQPGQHGGDDKITINGTVNGNVTGDQVSGIGGKDTIRVSQGGVVVGVVSGDGNSIGNGRGGNDTIIIEGTVRGTSSNPWAVVAGDVVNGNGGNDHITIEKTGTVYRLSGDAANKEGGDDTIIIKGTVTELARGDDTIGNGGDDTLIVESTGVTHTLSGDTSQSDGGKDTLIVRGKVLGNVNGDSVQGNGNNDSIDIYGIVEGGVYGDSTLSLNNGTGGSGADDVIIIRGGARVSGDVAGDFAKRHGGNDKITVNGYVGGDVFGDLLQGSANHNSGHDDIVINGNVKDVAGDQTFGDGGNDTILINGTVRGTVTGDRIVGNGNGTRGGHDVIDIYGTVNQDVYGDNAGVGPNSKGGWDEINIRNGAVVSGRVAGDMVGGRGGEDKITVMGGARVQDQIMGDFSNGDGGSDTIVIAGTVKDVIGDYTQKAGKKDFITIQASGLVNGSVYGDNPTRMGTSGGWDNIQIRGEVTGDVVGDKVGGAGGKDYIRIEGSALVRGSVYGEHASGPANEDSIFIHGRVNGSIIGDLASNNDADLITVAPIGYVHQDVIGDGSSTNAKGGADEINIHGTVNGNVYGDKNGGDGGNDRITIYGKAKVNGNVWGDVSRTHGGNDVIIVSGRVFGDVTGDSNNSGSGGDDRIVITQSGRVRNVYGDDSPGNGGSDVIEIRGTVTGNVLGDKVNGTPARDTIRIYASANILGNVCGDNFCSSKAGEVVFLSETTNLNVDAPDTIIIAGKVLGDVIAGTTFGNDADDTIIVTQDAEIGGTIFAGGEESADTLVYVYNIVNEEVTVAEVEGMSESITETQTDVTLNDATYQLDNVEELSAMVGYISCYGMDYRMNKTSDGCAQRSEAEQDSIQWHMDNPGNDGRLPGLEGCAVYPYGNAMRVYEIVNGEEGKLVAELSGEFLKDVPEQNELLGQTENGNVRLYHLASGELQIECRNMVDGNMQVRVLSDLAGTVVNAFDKS